MSVINEKQKDYDFLLRYSKKMLKGNTKEVREAGQRLEDYLLYLKGDLLQSNISWMVSSAEEVLDQFPDLLTIRNLNKASIMTLRFGSRIKVITEFVSDALDFLAIIRLKKKGTDD